MSKKTLETGESPQIVVDSVGSDLQVKGWDRAEALAKSSSDNDILLEMREDKVFVSCPTDCVLYVPQKASLQVQRVGSSAGLRAIEGAITIGSVGADLTLRNVDSAEIESVGADLSARGVRNRLSARQVRGSAMLKDVGEADLGGVGNQLIIKRARGNLQAEQVGGSVVGRDIDGQANLANVGGGLHLRDVSGAVNAQVGGSAAVDLAPVSWHTYQIRAGGAIRCNLPADADASIEIQSGAQHIHLRDHNGDHTIRQGTHAYTIGEGGATVKLAAGSNVEIICQSEQPAEGDNFEIDLGDELSSLADEIVEQTTRQIEAQMELLEEQLNTQMASLSASLGAVGIPAERMRQMEDRLAQARERAARRAKEASQRAQERLERKIAAAQRKAERKARAAAAREARKSRPDLGISGVTMPPPPPVAPAPPRAEDPVGEQERMMILQMLQERKISVEQAEQLLAALEGK